MYSERGLYSKPTGTLYIQLNRREDVPTFNRNFMNNLKRLVQACIEETFYTLLLCAWTAFTLSFNLGSHTFPKKPSLFKLMTRLLPLDF